MTVDDNGEVIRVGREAFNDHIENGNRFYTSLKRYLEMESRGGQIELQGRFRFADIVSGFLRESIGSAYERLRRPVGPGSKVVISIPNSFNPTAVEDVRQGVIRGLTALNGVAAPVSAANIRITRESEAIGFLYRRGAELKAPASGQSLQAELIEWQTVPDGTAVERPKGNERIIVLDVGGGTTDLSLLDIEEWEPEPSQTDIRVHVVMNAGMPLGGTDVDKILLRSMLDPQKQTAEDLKELPEDLRNRLLSILRDIKQRDSEQFFTEPENSPDEPLNETIKKVYDMFGGASFTRIHDEKTPGEIRRDALRRIGLLTDLSVAGLFDLIPKKEKDGIGTILLTGRASRLPRIQQAVLKQARELSPDVKVLTLKHLYHLKLAVAYGCALIQNHEFSGDKLPSGTLGRQLRVFGTGSAAAVEYDGTLPVSGIAPTLWHITCPRPKNGVRYVVWEYSTSVPVGFLNDYPPEQITWMGCSRPVAAWTVDPQGGGKPTRTVLLARHPATEAYYTFAEGDESEWKIAVPLEFDAAGINLVTGLPLGFPYEAAK